MTLVWSARVCMKESLSLLSTGVGGGRLAAVVGSERDFPIVFTCARTC